MEEAAFYSSTALNPNPNHSLSAQDIAPDLSALLAHEEADEAGEVLSLKRVDVFQDEREEQPSTSKPAPSHVSLEVEALGHLCCISMLSLSPLEQKPVLNLQSFCSILRSAI